VAVEEHVVVVVEELMSCGGTGVSEVATSTYGGTPGKVPYFPLRTSRSCSSLSQPATTLWQHGEGPTAKTLHVPF